MVCSLLWKLPWKQPIKVALLLSERVRIPKNNDTGVSTVERTLSEQRWGGRLKVTKLHATVLKTQIGHRTFIRVHAVLVFFALIDVTVTKFMWCVNFKVLVVVTVLIEIQSNSSYYLHDTGNIPVTVPYIFMVLNRGR